MMVVFYVIHHRGSEKITIHALRGEGDRAQLLAWRRAEHFYPRPPWGGRLHRYLPDPLVVVISIHALRGEGDRRGRCFPPLLRISIHALRGEGDAASGWTPGQTPRISIHALRGEGDAEWAALALWCHKFLSTPSVGRATGVGAPVDAFALISIHALRGEGDAPVTAPNTWDSDFYPRPPWGGRRPRLYKTFLRKEFLSTPSVGRATSFSSRSRSWTYYFYPRPPWGGRRVFATPSSWMWNFYPRPPWGGRLADRLLPVSMEIFLSTPSVGRATQRKLLAHALHGISIHALRGEGDRGRLCDGL